MKSVNEDSANTETKHSTAEVASTKKLTKKQKRRKAQRRQLLTVLAIAVMVIVVVAGVLVFNKWKDKQVETLPADQRITAIVNGEETDIAPYIACELDDKECQDQENKPFELDLHGAKEFTLKVPSDVAATQWAMLQIFNDPGANTEKTFAPNESSEVTIKLDSDKVADDKTTPRTAVVEIHSMLVGLDDNDEQTPVNTVWSIAPKA